MPKCVYRKSDSVKLVRPPQLPPPRGDDKRYRKSCTTCSALTEIICRKCKRILCSPKHSTNDCWDGHYCNVKEDPKRKILLKAKEKLAEEQDKRAADAAIEAGASEEGNDQDSEDSAYEDSEDGYDDDNVLDIVSRSHNYDDELIDSFQKFLEEETAKLNNLLSQLTSSK